MGPASQASPPNVVLIHGLNSTGQSWSEVLAHLPANLHCKTPDCPPLPSVEAIASSLISDLPPRFHVVGYSFGGYVALALLELFASQIESVVLIATSAFPDTDAQRQFRQGAIAQVLERDYTAMAIEQFATCVHPTNRADRDIYARYLAAVQAAGSARYVAHQQACMNRPDRTLLLAKAGKPSLLVTPEVDNVIPVRRQLRSVAAIPHVAVKAVPGTGHLLPFEAPSAIAGIIGQWVSRQARISHEGKAPNEGLSAVPSGSLRRP